MRVIVQFDVDVAWIVRTSDNGSSTAERVSLYYYYSCTILQRCARTVPGSRPVYVPNLFEDVREFARTSPDSLMEKNVSA